MVKPGGSLCSHSFLSSRRCKEGAGNEESPQDAWLPEGVVGNRVPQEASLLAESQQGCREEGGTGKASCSFFPLTCPTPTSALGLQSPAALDFKSWEVTLRSRIPTSPPHGLGQRELSTSPCLMSFFMGAVLRKSTMTQSRCACTPGAHITHLSPL